jgi:hypothetical protein
VATQSPPVVSDPRNATIAASFRAVQFATSLVQPPSPVYLETEDQILFTIYAPTAPATWVINLEARFLRPDGQIVTLRVPIGPATPTINRMMNTGEGFLLSLTASRASAPSIPRGQIFVQAHVVRNTAGDQVFGWALLSDYVTTNFHPSWPGSPLRSPVEGPGNIRSVTGAVPGAGVDISDPVPVAVRWRLITAKASLTTAVAVANRFTQWTIDDGALVLFNSVQPAAQVASTAVLYTATFMPTPPVAGVGAVILSIPADIRLTAGYHFRTTTSNIQAADQWTAVQYLVEEWVDI